MNARLRIRDVTAECGERAQGFVTIGEAASGPLQLPVVIINGRDDGPILCLTAGVHATEYAPIDAVMRIVQELRPDGLRGAVIAVPVANMCMFEGRTGFVSPLDGLNLNKIGGGRRDGSLSEILAHVLLEEIIGVAQYHIDLHAGDLGEMLMPFAGFALTGQRRANGNRRSSLVGYPNHSTFAVLYPRAKESGNRTQHRRQRSRRVGVAHDEAQQAGIIADNAIPAWLGRMLAV